MHKINFVFIVSTLIAMTIFTFVPQLLFLTVISSFFMLFLSKENMIEGIKKGITEEGEKYILFGVKVKHTYINMVLAVILYTGYAYFIGYVPDIHFFNMSAELFRTMYMLQTVMVLLNIAKSTYVMDLYEKQKS